MNKRKKKVERESIKTKALQIKKNKKIKDSRNKNRLYGPPPKKKEIKKENANLDKKRQHRKHQNLAHENRTYINAKMK